MATIPTIPSVPKLPSVSVPKVSVPKLPSGPKLPVVPTKINVKVGTGVPGGFTAASNKIPTAEVAKYAGAISKVASNMSAIKALAALSPAAGALLAPFKSKMNSTLSSYAKKMKDAKLAPNFKAAASIPKLPSAPSIEVPKLPELPSLPNLPSVPSVPSVPNASALASNLPSAPKLPSISGIG